MRGKGQPLIYTRHMAEGSYSPCTKSHSFHLNQHVWLLYARLRCQIPVIPSSLFIIYASLDIWFDRRDLQNILQRLHLLFLPTDGEKKQKSSCMSARVSQRETFRTVFVGRLLRIEIKTRMLTFSNGALLQKKKKETSKLEAGRQKRH